MCGAREEEVAARVSVVHVAMTASKCRRRYVYGEDVGSSVRILDVVD